MNAPTAGQPKPLGTAALLGRVALLGPAALSLAWLAAFGSFSAARTISSWISGSLAFSATLLVMSVLACRAFPEGARDRAASVAALASVGAAPFIAFCCDQALTIPTWDSRPLEGIGTFVMAAIALALFLAGPLVGFWVALPLGVWANRDTRAFMRFLAALAIAAALPVTIASIARRHRFPDPDGYVASLPTIPRTDGDTCSAPLCVRCKDGSGPRPLVRVTPAGANDFGEVMAPCDKLGFHYDPAHRLLLVSGDVDRGRDRHAWPAVWVYDESNRSAFQRHMSELKDTLAPPLPWVLEAVMGLLGAIAALAIGILRARRDPSAPDADARATAHATVAFATVALLTTPLATAWYAGLLPLR